MKQRRISQDNATQLINFRQCHAQQNNLANQEKVVVNGRHCVDKQSLCVLKKIGV